MSSRIISDRIHAKLIQFCLPLLQKGTFIQPNLDDSDSDRRTGVRLTPAQTKSALRVFRQYEKCLARFIKKYSTFLSRSDINLLLANTSEIKTYVLMKRRGQDVTIAMYRKFYKSELTDLILQQITLCNLVEHPRSYRNMSQKRSHWRYAPLTLGVEEEHQIVSTSNWELAQDVDSIIKTNRKSRFSREVYKSQIETKTSVCDNVRDAATALNSLRRSLQGSLPTGLAVLSAGTHPFSTWNTQRANDSARTALFMHDMQDVVRRLVTFGLHVHVGVDNRELAVQIMNDARHFLPLLLAISTSSPFWEGRVTGLSSTRSTVFSSLPRTGIPPVFDGERAYDEYLQTLRKTNSFDSEGNFDPTKIWWDVRLHPKHPTIEFRICDACTRLTDAICIVALCQAIVAKLAKLHHEGLEVNRPPKHIIEENKWRAIRYGHKARFIEPLTQREVTLRYCSLQLLDFIEDVVPDLGTETETRHILTILDEGSSAAKQLDKLADAKASKDTSKDPIREVVKWLASEFVIPLRFDHLYP